MSKFEQVGFLIFGLVFVSRDFEVLTNVSCEESTVSSRRRLIFFCLIFMTILPTTVLLALCMCFHSLINFQRDTTHTTHTHTNRIESKPKYKLTGCIVQIEEQISKTQSIFRLSEFWSEFRPSIAIICRNALQNSVQKWTE